MVAAQAACTGKARLDSRLGGARARAERTKNIWPTSATLDVSKLSGWLNADARCRVERRAYTMWGELCGPGGRRVWGGGGGSGMHGEGPTQGLGAGGYARSARRTCRACA